MKDLAKIFALTVAEGGVFKVLTYDNATSIAETVHRSTLPRTTVVYAIESLHKRGLIRRKSLGKRVLWKRTSKSVLIKKLQRAVSTIDINLAPQKEGLVPKEIEGKTTVEVREGSAELLGAYEQMFRGYKNERMIFSQSAEVLEQIITKLPMGSINKINKTGVEYEGIIEIVATNDVLARYKELAKDKAWMQNIAGRMMIMNLVSDGALAHSGASIGVLRDQVVLTDWINEVVVVIKNKEMTKLFKQLLHNTSMLGKHFNLSEFLRENI